MHLQLMHILLARFIEESRLPSPMSRSWKSKLVESVCRHSVVHASKQSRLEETMARLREIVPDISNQESSERDVFNDYWEYKRRSLQAFQVKLMLKMISMLPKGKKSVVDIGDSAGTHMLYLKSLAIDDEIDTLSVNLDPRAIAKIKSRGLSARLCRAEDLDMNRQHVDFFTSFQMIEHLHDPVMFMRRLSLLEKTPYFVISVPFLRRSRVGLHHVRQSIMKTVHAEDVHIFELSPEDWSLLFRHAGWKVIHSDIHFQYPKGLPLLTSALAKLWRYVDYEGFWGAILEKDHRISSLYCDWPEQK